MNIKKLHFPSVGVIGLLLSGLLRVLSALFAWPISLVIVSEIVLLIAVAWILMFDVFPLFLNPFYAIRKQFSKRQSLFVALVLFFAATQITTWFLPSGVAKDTTTTLAFLSFMAAVVWGISAYIFSTFTPFVRYMKRPPRQVERVTYADVITSMAIIIVPTVILSFILTPTGLSQAVITPYQVFVSSFLTNIFMATYIYLFVIRPKIFTRRQLGLRKIDREDAGKALVLFILVTVLVVIAQAFLTRIGVQLAHYSFNSRDGALFLFISAVVVTPFIEELYFRGFLFKGLLLHNPPWVAYVASAGLFALLHPPLLVMVEAFVVGLLLAYLVKETKSIWPGVIIHSLNNAIIFWFLLYL